MLVAIVFVAGVSLATGFYVIGRFNPFYSTLTVFFSVNLIVVYWEICLLVKQSYIEERVQYWTEQLDTVNVKPIYQFLSTRVPLSQVFKFTVWADAWATYSFIDGAYPNRSSAGFNIDICNGIFTPIVSVILYLSYTFQLFNALIAGVLGIVLFTIWSFVTATYMTSFFVAGRHKLIPRFDTWVFVVGINLVWIFLALVGMYVSISLIVQDDFGVLGF